MSNFNGILNSQLEKGVVVNHFIKMSHSHFL